MLFRYEVEVCKDVPECGETSVEYSGKSLNATIENLEPHTKYKFRITSFNSYGSCESEWSEYKTDKEGSINKFLNYKHIYKLIYNKVMEPLI